MGSKLVVGDPGGPVSWKTGSNMELWRVLGELGIEEASSDGGLEKPVQLCGAIAICGRGASCAAEAIIACGVGEAGMRHGPEAGVPGMESAGGGMATLPGRLFLALRESCLGVT